MDILRTSTFFASFFVGFRLGLGCFWSFFGIFAAFFCFLFLVFLLFFGSFFVGFRLVLGVFGLSWCFCCFFASFFVGFSVGFRAFLVGLPAAFGWFLVSFARFSVFFWLFTQTERSLKRPKLTIFK